MVDLDKDIELYRSKVAFYESQNTRGEYAVTVRELKFVVETLEAIQSERLQGDLISRSALINAKPEFRNEKVVRDTKYRTAKDRVYARAWNACNSYWLNVIKNVPTIEETEKPFIAECRDTALKMNLPLYFVYYEETGILEVYVTETKELFEKRHCSKHMSNYEFKELVTRYLDNCPALIFAPQ